MKNQCTTGWLVYRTIGGRVEFSGLYQTKRAAEKEIETLSGLIPGDWRVASVPFLGWGQVIFDQNGPAPKASELIDQTIKWN